MADPRAVIALLIIFFIVFSPDPQSAPIQSRNRLEDVLAKEVHALSVLNSTQYGDFDPSRERWLNISGFTNDTQYAWEALHKVKERARQLSIHALGADNERRLDGDETGPALPLYSNITGVVHGTWTRSTLSKDVKVPELNLTEYAPLSPFGPLPITTFGRNITSKWGDMRVRFNEPDGDSTVFRTKSVTGEDMDVARKLGAQISVGGDDGVGDGFDIQMHGIHNLGTGNVVLSTTSDKFSGIFALPHMTISQFEYEIAQTLLNRTIRMTVEEQMDGWVRPLNPWSSLGEGVAEGQFTLPNCELIVYLQQNLGSIPRTSSKGMPSGLLGFIEQELRVPTGALVPPAYDMQFSMLAFSPDCGFVIESKGPPDYAVTEANHLIGPKVEVEYAQGRHHLLIFAMVLATQLWLLTNQMREASTPSTRSRISFYTISMLALGDGFTTMTFALISLFVPGLWVALIATSFLAFLSVSFFGMRFLMDIWAVQAPERERRERQRRAAMAPIGTATSNQVAVPNADPPAAAATGNPSVSPSADTPPATDPFPAVQIPIITPAGVDSLPLPTSVTRPIDTGATPVFIPSDQDAPAEETLPTVRPGATATPMANAEGAGSSFGALYTRFYFLLLATLFLSLNATSWPASFRRAYFTLLAFCYLSFWVPQIHRNSIRNCRRALRWDFVVGQSILRLVPFAYFYGYGSNVLFAEVDLVDFAVLAVWVWIQCLALISQEIVGPRWFVKNDWVPPAYDYHPLLREDEEGGNLPIGFSQAAAMSPTLSPTLSAKASESRDKNKRTFDCAICMQDLEVPVIGPEGAGESGLTAGGMLARRAYMVTPCRHIFHSNCLEGWMKYRLQCPICRETLPPL